MKFSPESFIQYSFLSNPRISPDGDKVLYQIEKARLEQNDYSAGLFFWDCNDKKTSP